MSYVQYTNANGEVVDLDDGVNTTFLMGRTNMFAPTYALRTAKAPLQPGTFLTQIDVDSRVVDIPIRVVDDDYESLVGTIRDIVKKLNPLIGDGRLRYTSPTGDTVELVCRYKNGLQGIDNTGNGQFVNSALFVLTFEAQDPYYYAQTATSVSASASDLSTFFPIPQTLGSGTQTFINLPPAYVFAEETINNGGDVVAYPVWTITGPGSAISVINETTGEALVVSETLADGDTLVIDTRPGEKTVTYNGSTNWFGKMTTTSVLWGLDVGNNEISIYMTGTTSSSLISGEFYERYETIKYA